MTKLCDSCKHRFANLENEHEGIEGELSHFCDECQETYEKVGTLQVCSKCHMPKKLTKINQNDLDEFECQSCEKNVYGWSGCCTSCGDGNSELDAGLCPSCQR